MPLYAYACRRCGAAFDVQLTFAEFDRARPRCPECRSRRVRRQLAAPGMKVKRGPALTRDQMEQAARLTERRLGAGGGHSDGGAPEHQPHS